MQNDIIKNCEFNRLESLINNKEETLRKLHKLAQEEDMRSYAFIVAMIEYCKFNNRKDIVAELSHFASFISLVFFNYIEGMISLGYAHQKEAIKYDPDNFKYKKAFLEMYYGHPDVKHDFDYEVKIAKSMPNDIEIAKRVIRENHRT